MRILITGGAGFIGSHLADLHRARGDVVTVVDDLSTGTRANLATHIGRPGFCLERADLLEWPALAEVVASSDRVYHLAAVVGVQRVLDDPMRCLDVNIQTTRRVLDAVLASPQRIPLLLASSSEVYGFNRNPSFYEEGSLVLHSSNFERWSYTVSKLVDETLAAIAARQRHHPLVTVRLFNTIGPRQQGAYGMVVPNFVRRAVAGQPLLVYGDGAQTRAFCDVRDAVRALASLLESPAAHGRIVNVGRDQELSIAELAQRVITRAGSASGIEYRSYEQAYGQDFTDIGHRSPDLSLLHKLIDFEHDWSLDDTLDDLIALARAEQAAVSVHSTGA